MRLIERCGVAVLCVMVSGCGGSGGGGAVEQQAEVSALLDDLGQPAANRVNIHVACTGQRADVHLNPWRRAVRPGQTVEFRLVGGTAIERVLILPKPAGDLTTWPNSGDTLIVNRQQNTQTPAAPANDTGVDIVYSYSVQGTCTFGNVDRDVILDPDLIVEGGGAADSVP